LFIIYIYFIQWNYNWNIILNKGLQNKTYTKEQLAEVEKIKNCKDYYELFGISKDASEGELKKAYRKVNILFLFVFILLDVVIFFKNKIR